MPLVLRLGPVGYGNVIAAANTAIWGDDRSTKVPAGIGMDGIPCDMSHYGNHQPIKLQGVRWLLEINTW
ncbi:hypothetical protein E2562_010527 [Oryza meyeriana var. granulata]|uniref:Uncharacterized protein n=1 Tax=Oryza meyeriana var. granulata TaxID=110450 RepID=A0A6G1DWB3_9ORYZ|nr:hypothetical protein E2562_010527 [Oryza meyeriana var. granulata]